MAGRLSRQKLVDPQGWFSLVDEFRHVPMVTVKKHR
jgi:hypothetical protein